MYKVLKDEVDFSTLLSIIPDNLYFGFLSLDEKSIRIED